MAKKPEISRLETDLCSLCSFFQLLTRGREKRGYIFVIYISLSCIVYKEVKSFFTLCIKCSRSACLRGFGNEVLCAANFGNCIFFTERSCVQRRIWDVGLTTFTTFTTEKTTSKKPETTRFEGVKWWKWSFFQFLTRGREKEDIYLLYIFPCPVFIYKEVGNFTTFTTYKQKSPCFRGKMQWCFRWWKKLKNHFHHCGRRMMPRNLRDWLFIPRMI